MKKVDPPNVEPDPSYADVLKSLSTYLHTIPAEVSALAYEFQEFLDRHYEGNYKHSIKTTHGFPLSSSRIGADSVYVSYKIIVSVTSENVYHDDVEITKEILIKMKVPYFGKSQTVLFTNTRTI